MRNLLFFPRLCPKIPIISRARATDLSSRARYLGLNFPLSTLALNRFEGSNDLKERKGRNKNYNEKVALSSDILKPDILPRSYQSSIALSASKANTLVILPTGLGKTLIAVLVSEMRLREFGSRGRVLVLAPTRPLVLQHKETFEKSLLLDESRFVLLTGETDLEERAAVWDTAGSQQQFVFATPETVLNDILIGNASLKDFVLVVFDEAHRAVGDYAYTEVARLYPNQSPHPLILGLTASPGGSIERVDEVVRNLFIKKVESRNEEDVDVKEYVEDTKLERIKVGLPVEFNSLRNMLRSLYDEKIDKLKRGGFVKPSFFRGQPRITKLFSIPGGRYSQG